MPKIPPPPKEPPNPHRKGGSSPARTQPQRNVCDECGYHNSHAPTCSKAK